MSVNFDIEKLVPVNHLTSRSDKHLTSPYNIHTLSSKQVIRVLNPYQVEVVSWTNIKFLWLSYKEMCSSQRGELTIRFWEFKG